jgi:hypothetical protein
MAQYRVLASEGRQRYIYTKTHKNIKEKKIFKFGKAKKQKIYRCLMRSIFDSAGVKWELRSRKG